MGNCLSKLNNKPFTLYTPSLTAGHLKKVASGIRKNPVKYFTSGVHRNQEYEKPTQNIKSSTMDVHDRFPPQSCKLRGYQRYSILSLKGGVVYCPF